MKISVTEILPGDELQLADGSKKRATGAWSAGPLASVEVAWADGSEKCVFPRGTTLTVLSRLHMAVPSEEDEQKLQEFFARRLEGHGKVARHVIQAEAILNPPRAARWNGEASRVPAALQAELDRTPAVIPPDAGPPAMAPPVTNPAVERPAGTNPFGLE